MYINFFLLESGGCGSDPAGNGVDGDRLLFSLRHKLPSSIVAGGGKFCGGSLIDEQRMLTAAYCVDQESLTPSHNVVRLVTVLHWTLTRLSWW